jgi:hypothetical protein
VVWDCNAPKIDYEYDGRNNNQWINNVLSVARKEPTEANPTWGTLALPLRALLYVRAKDMEKNSQRLAYQPLCRERFGSDQLGSRAN